MNSHTNMLAEHGRFGHVYTGDLSEMRKGLSTCMCVCVCVCVYTDPRVCGRAHGPGAVHTVSVLWRETQVECGARIL